jgi:flagellin
MVAEGGLSDLSNFLQQMRYLALESANGTLTNSDRASLNEESTQLRVQLNRVSGSTQFNDKNLLDGSYQEKFHVGASKNQTVSVEIGDMSSTGLGLGATNISSRTGANSALQDIDSAINSVNSQRARIGATSNRLEFLTYRQMNTSNQLSGSVSIIRDSDLAQESVNLNKQRLLDNAMIAIKQGVNINASAV